MGVRELRQHAGKRCGSHVPGLSICLELANNNSATLVEYAKDGRRLVS